MYKDKLHELQIVQLLHDQKYHADILCLPVQRRANHMGLHFAKYAGKFVEAKLAKDRDSFLSALIDTFIISLASANMFNIEVGKLSVFDEVKTKKLDTLGVEIFSFSESKNEDIFTFMADNITIFQGRIAKSIESLDHMEAYSFRETFEENLESIIGSVFVASTFLKIDLISKAKERLVSVEKKSIFYGDYETARMKAQHIAR